MTVTLDINGRRVQVGDEFRTMTPEQQESTVQEIASSFDAAPTPEAPSATPVPQDPGAMGWVNRGIANGMDGLVAAANALPNAAIRGMAGLAGVEDPFQFGNQPTADLMDMSGIARAQQAPETLMQRGFSGAGEAASMLLPMGALAKGLSGLGGVAGGIGQMVNNPMVQAPVRATAAELAAGAGAQVGGELASEASGGAYGDIARPLGELGGSLTAALAPAGAMRLAYEGIKRTPVVGTLGTVIAREAAPFTRAGAREIARNRVQGLSSDPAAQAAAINPNSPLSAAQQTGDPNLMALERAVIDQNPTMRPEFDQGNINAANMLGADARQGTGQVGDASEFLRRRTEAVTGRLNQWVTRAQEDAERRIARLSPERSASENSTIVREELDKAYSQAKAEERRVWEALPQDINIPTAGAREAYRAIAGEAGPVRMDRLPEDARRWLGGNAGFGEEAPIRDVRALYSELRQTARNARTGETPNAFTAKAADDIADGILRDMDSVTGLDPDVATTYQAARAYTAAMKEAFGQGNVGRIRANAATGGDRVDPALTLDRAIGSGGTSGAVGLDDMRGAVNFRRPDVGSAVDAPVEDFMRNQLQRRGDFTPRAAAGFQRANSELLDRLPQLDADINQAVTGVQRAEQVAERMGGAAAAMTDPRRSTTAAFAQAKPGREMVDAVFSANNPAQAARQIATQVSRDQTGQAVSGLKGGAVDYLMEKSATGFAPNGDRLISGNTLNGMLQDRQTRAALAQIYEPQELSRLDKIASEFQKLETSRKTTPLGTVLDAEPNKIISYMGGTMAARFGAQLGAGTSGASLRTASQTTKRFNDILASLTGDRAEALIRDAITDPELFRDLLMPLNTPARTRKAQARLVEWAEGYAATQIAGEDE